MDSYQRQGLILAALEETGYVKLGDLVNRLGVSPVTVHRDLDALSQARVLRRVRGGARSYHPRPHEIRTEYVLRQAQEPELKYAIGDLAREYIPDGSTIFMDASTTTYAMIGALERRPPTALTIVTNSVMIASQLHSSQIRVIMTPGDVDNSLWAVTGTWTINFLSSMKFNYAFISGAAISISSGIATQQRNLADIAEVVLPRSEKKFALLDSTKFNTNALISFAQPETIDVLITDEALEEETLREYEALNWQIASAPLPE